MANELKNARILVIGGAGFIGSHIVNQLISEGPKEIIVFDNFTRGSTQNLTDLIGDYNITIVDGDITNIEDLDHAFDKVDFVFCLAALWLLTCEKEPRSSVEVNIVGSFNVMEMCVKHNIKKLVFSSSSSVYGDGLYLPTDEDHPFNNDLFYGASKVANEQHLRSFHKKYGLDYIGLRYLNVYGVGQDYHGAYIGVIMHFLNKLDKNESPIIFGTGDETLDLVNVIDVARANIISMKSDLTNDFFNVASGKETTLTELASMLIDITERSVKPAYKERDANLVTRRWGSSKKAKEVLGFECIVNDKDGLKQIVEWRNKKKINN